MKFNTELVVPHSCSVMGTQEMEQITGGALTTSGVLGFISYLLGGLDVSFGSKNSQVNTDTVATASQASTSSIGRRGSSSVSAVATHSNVDTISSGRYFDWGASFNLGSLFNQLVRLFL
ncbi:hypothetical protein [Faecalibacterium sp. An122]|uniref:hypothetical protein n=1 Tax=Faecalibacterium sp. An122 TaxID=1965551 RepID=UPI000B388565|nr:hypothetical protein [Faecalibacterium sp. An122]OUQ34535.1 hypothetical protein B5E67_13365 [Faecalibacterium sp. An122]